MNLRTIARRVLAPALVALVAVGIVAGSAIADGMHMGTHEASPKMSVKIYVSKDRKAGYNLHVTTKRFKWAPWNASKNHISGQGHAHLYIDGEKVTRLYGPWYYLGTLDKGTHTIKVTLNANDHSDYEHDEMMVADQKTITVK
ncbi:MAG: hypothetical protein KDC46_12420 [Thermoleophilia bacterium]|nr:hypothetical protein [Thermoleophilia bacterium]